MEKVLLIQEVIPRYRIPVFNELSKRVDLTVIYSKGILYEGIEFKTIKIPVVKIKHFGILHKKPLSLIANKYDVVIGILGLGYWSIRALPIIPWRKYKFIVWGIGVAASYTVRYDSTNIYDKRITRYISQSDAAIFYSAYPVEKYTTLGIPRKKLFVANNTVDVCVSKDSQEKNIILFVGTLYKEKKIFDLLSNYKMAFEINPDIFDMVIIGDGEEYEKIGTWIESNNMKDKVLLKGPIYDESVLSKYFLSSIICVSPYQAGLSVLKAMGYGVPFVTMRNAITGGEIFNIINGVNGILLESIEDLKNVILDAAQNPNKYVMLGENAKRFYQENRQIVHLVDGFVEAIEYVQSK